MSTKTTCAKCGACTAVCPTYRASSRESLTARGKVHLLENIDKDERSGNFSNVFFQCLLCGACTDICPRGLDLTKIFIGVRNELPPSDARHPIKKYLAAKTLASPLLLKSATGLLRSAVSVFDRLPSKSGLRLKLANSTAFSEPGPAYLAAKEAPSDLATMAYFTGCTANFLTPQIGHDTDYIVEKYTGATTMAPKNQNCCGLAAYAAGDINSAKELARRNIAAFYASEDIRDKPILTSCASCFSHLKGYGNLLSDDKEWRQKAATFSSRILEFSSWLLPIAEPALSPKDNTSTIFYHDPCHLRYNHKITAPPRQLLEKITGNRPRELANGGQCCGMGGLFQLSYPEQSQQIFTSLAAKIKKLEVETVTTTCAGCLLQLQRGLGEKPQIKVIHLVRLVAAALKKRKRSINPTLRKNTPCPL